MNPKATWSGSLESYHAHILPQKNSKNSKISCIYNTLLKIAKSHFDFLRTLGIVSYSFTSWDRARIASYHSPADNS
jgi:hypothetical protein